MTLSAPFPYIGGKRSVAGFVWSRFGDPRNYIEPFCGSCSVLLSRPHPARVETVNDADALLANFWRALRADPIGMAELADWPINEADLHPRHEWLVRNRERIRGLVMADPDAYDLKAAAWWVWGIGGRWLSRKARGTALPGKGGPVKSHRGERRVKA